MTLNYPSPSWPNWIRRRTSNPKIAGSSPAGGIAGYAPSSAIQQFGATTMHGAIQDSSCFQTANFLAELVKRRTSMQLATRQGSQVLMCKSARGSNIVTCMSSQQGHTRSAHRCCINLCP